MSSPSDKALNTNLIRASSESSGWSMPNFLSGRLDNAVSRTGNPLATGSLVFNIAVCEQPGFRSRKIYPRPTAFQASSGDARGGVGRLGFHGSLARASTIEHGNGVAIGGRPFQSSLARAGE